MSLLLFAVLTALWLRGYSAFDRFIWCTEAHCFQLEIRKGGLAWIVARRDAAARAEWEARWRPSRLGGQGGGRIGHKIDIVPPESIIEGRSFERQSWGTRYLRDSIGPGRKEVALGLVGYNAIASPAGDDLAREWTVPLRGPMLLAAAAPIAWVMFVGLPEWRRRVARRRGLCAACGYDLR